MGLAETQRLLAQLSTDSGLRERFGTDPEGVSTEWGLGADDRDAMGRLSVNQLQFFARSLQIKRLGEVRKLLPQTCRALGLRAVPLFRRFADQSVPSGLHKHRTDALGFAVFLETILPEETALPLWLLDVLRYEAGWLTAGRWHVCKTRCDIAAFLRGLERGDTPDTASRPAFALWWRLSASGPLRHRIVWLSRRRKE